MTSRSLCRSGCPAPGWDTARQRTAGGPSQSGLWGQRATGHWYSDSSHKTSLIIKIKLVLTLPVVITTWNLWRLIQLLCSTVWFFTVIIQVIIISPGNIVVLFKRKLSHVSTVTGSLRLAQDSCSVILIWSPHLPGTIHKHYRLSDIQMLVHLSYKLEIAN